jgi:hypothetical protein
MRQWLVGVVGLYPRTIRERYGEEISDLLVNSPTPVRDLADVAWCALRDRISQQTEPMTMLRARAGALTLAKLLLIPLGFAIALVALTPVLGPMQFTLEGLGISLGQPESPGYGILGVLPVGLLAWWLGRRLGQAGTIAAGWALVPAALALSMIAMAGVPGPGMILGETASSSMLATLCWGVGLAALGLLVRNLMHRNRVAAGWTAGIGGGLLVLTLSTATYVFSGGAISLALPPDFSAVPVVSREHAPYWYLGLISGIYPDDAGVSGDFIMLSDAVKALPAVHTLCTIFTLALIAAATGSICRTPRESH